MVEDAIGSRGLMVGAESNAFDTSFYSKAVGALIAVVSVPCATGTVVAGFTLVGGAAWVINDAKIGRVPRDAKQKSPIIVNEGTSRAACQMNRVENMCTIIHSCKQAACDP